MDPQVWQLLIGIAPIGTHGLVVGLEHDAIAQHACHLVSHEVDLARERAGENSGHELPDHEDLLLVHLGHGVHLGLELAIASEDLVLKVLLVHPELAQLHTPSRNRCAELGQLHGHAMHITEPMASAIQLNVRGDVHQPAVGCSYGRP